jgi:DNA-binding SARP family transcriptional activator
MSLRVNLFGAAFIEADGVPVTGRAAQGRRLALLALLVCARGRSLTREKVLGLLWPESPDDRARRQLSDEVYICAVRWVSTWCARWATSSRSTPTP